MIFTGKELTKSWLQIPIYKWLVLGTAIFVIAGCASKGPYQFHRYNFWELI